MAKKEQRPVFFVCYVGAAIFKDHPAAPLIFLIDLPGFCSNGPDAHQDA